jgi:hypothetical protein
MPNAGVARQIRAHRTKLRAFAMKGSRSVPSGSLPVERRDRNPEPCGDALCRAFRYREEGTRFSRRTSARTRVRGTPSVVRSYRSG